MDETNRLELQLPSFIPPEYPRQRPLDPPLPEAQDQPELDQPASQDRAPRFGPELPRSEPADTPTATSSAGAKTPRWTPSGNAHDVGLIVAGLAVLALGFAAMGLRTRGLKLRMPTEPETTAISEPIGRILVRHLPMAGLGPDIADGLVAVAETQKYMQRGRLVTPITDTQEEA